MSDFLASMFASSRRRAEVTRSRHGMRALEALATSAPAPVPFALAHEGFDLLAEVKPASPSEGRLISQADAEALVDLAGRLTAAGPVGLSVLTEPSAFGGELLHLESIVGAVDIPVMRKDFLVDPIQILEARASGASGVLLIARGGDATNLTVLTDLALDLGMFVLVEVFDEEDIDRASAVFDRDVFIGVNARDLITLDVDPTRHEVLAARLPTHLPSVAESGLLAADDVAAVATLGYRLALVGTALVRSADPGAAANAMLRAGRLASRDVVVS